MITTQIETMNLIFLLWNLSTLLGGNDLAIGFQNAWCGMKMTILACDSLSSPRDNRFFFAKPVI